MKNKETYTYNQNQAIEISEAFSKDRRPGEYNAYSTLNATEAGKQHVTYLISVYEWMAGQIKSRRMIKSQSLFKGTKTGSHEKP